MEHEVRAGIVGLGLAAGAHLKGYLAHHAASVEAVCDVDAGRARAFASAHDIPRVYTSYEEMLADPRLNVIDIATPTYLHAAMAEKAAAAGRNVHCEKPFCCTLAEGQRVCATVREKGVTLLVGETYVFLTSHRTARELIDAGEIGRPLQVRLRHGAWRRRQQAGAPPSPPPVRWRSDPLMSGGGAFPWLFDHAVHFFAASELFMQGMKVAEVSSLTRRDVTDIPLITWRCEDPSHHGVWMRAERANGMYDPMSGFSTTVVGEKGAIEVLGEGGDGLFWEGKRQHLVLHREGKPVRCLRFEEGGDDVWDSEISYYGKGHMTQVHSLVDAVLTGAPSPYSGEDGVHAVQCTLAAILSAVEHRPVRVDEVPADYAAARTVIPVGS